MKDTLKKKRTVKVKIDYYLKVTLEVLAEKQKIKAYELASNLVAQRCIAPSRIEFLKAVICADKVQCTTKKGDAQ